MKAVFYGGLCVLFVSACGSTDGGSGNIGDTGGTGSVTTSGGTTATTGTGGTPNIDQNSQAVMDSGTYNVSITLDTTSGYTTCTVAGCQSIQSSPAYYSWVVTDNGNGGTSYSIDGSGMVAVTSGNQWNGGAGPTYGTTEAGCMDQLVLAESLTLSATSFVGGAIFNFQAQACNGYSSVNCDCAYDITATETTSSDGGERLIVGDQDTAAHSAIDEMTRQAHQR